MGHTVRAFIAKADTLLRAARDFQTAHVIPIEQGFALLLNTREFYDEAGGGGVDSELSGEEFYNLSAELAKLGAGWSESGAVAYVETDYWGGEGEQAAVLWERGRITYAPAKAKIGPINDVLRRMGVERGEHLDEFEAVGLHRYRNNEDWSKQSHNNAST